MQQYRNNRNNGNIYDLRKDLQHTPPPSQQKGSSGSADGRYGFIPGKTNPHGTVT